MPLTTIDLAKEAAPTTYEPLLLAVFTFTDGSVRRYSTHPLNAAEGGFPYAGNDYFARILGYDLGAIQALSEQGIDQLAQVTLHLADAPGTLYDLERTVGFAGASLTLTFIFWDADTSTFSSDSIVKFEGVCGSAECPDSKTLAVTAQNKVNLARKLLPVLPIQTRCANLFPATVADRQSAADDPAHPSFGCGYSPDASGGNARGNYQTGVTSFLTCSYTKEDCVARGMYSTDSSARATRRFTGMQYDLPAPHRSREYVSGAWTDPKTYPSESVRGEYVPLVYGTTWVDALAQNVAGEGNSTRGEAVLCNGQIKNIRQVVVNGTTVPPASDFEFGTVYIVQDVLFRYNPISNGSRTGAFNADTPYNGLGDPYSSSAVILWVVPRQLAESGSAPSIKALIDGRLVRVYTDSVTYTFVFSSNPIWVMLDILVLSGFTYDDFNLDTFVSAAAYCDAFVSYTDQNGNSSSHARYSCSLVVKSRRTAADVIRGLRSSCGAIFVQDAATGKHSIVMEKTLADQQPSDIGSSNYHTGVTSKHADGSVGTGYVAYHFNESTILKDDRSVDWEPKSGADTDEPSIRVPLPRPLSDTPNRIAFQFVNAEREWVQDSISVADVPNVLAVGQQVTASYQVDGINTLDQAKRICSQVLAKGLQGNPRGDSKGTWYVELWSSFRAVRVSVGQIVLLSYARRTISNQLCRVLQVQPDSNYERVRFLLAFHNDDWYVDSLLQTGADPRHRDLKHDRLLRGPYPWSPNQIQPPGDDSMYSGTERFFAVDELHSQSADGTPITQLRITGALPVNEFGTARPPTLANLQGTTTTTGGALLGSGRVYFLAISAKDSDGHYSPLSSICQVAITDTGVTNTATVPIEAWPDPSLTAGWALFAGLRTDVLTFQLVGSGTPSTVTLTSFDVRAWGAPDGEFSDFDIEVRREWHSGVLGAAITGVALRSLTVAGAGWTVNQFANYDCSILAKADLSSVPVIDMQILSNTADTLTIKSTSPDPDALGVVAGDVLTVRSTPTVGSDGAGLYLHDDNWVNTTSGGTGLAIDSTEIGRYVLFVSGPARGDQYKIKQVTDGGVADSKGRRIYVNAPGGVWVNTPTSASRYVIVDSVTQVPSSGPYDNQEPTQGAFMTFGVDNFQATVILVRVGTVDAGGMTSLAQADPFREIYLYGAPSTALYLKDKSVDFTLAAGVAAFAFDQSTGRLQYSIDGGVTWMDLATGGGGAVGIVQKNITLTANSQAIPAPSELDGTLLVYRLIQNASAPADGWTVVWATAFTGGPAQPGPGANKVSIFLFWTFSATDVRPISFAMLGQD